MTPMKTYRYQAGPESAGRGREARKGRRVHGKGKVVNLGAPLQVESVQYGTHL